MNVSNNKVQGVKSFPTVACAYNINQASGHIGVDCGHYLRCAGINQRIISPHGIKTLKSNNHSGMIVERQNYIQDSFIAVN